MSKNHLKRLAAPNTWPIERKKTKYIAKPMPGMHSIKEGMALGVILKEILNIAKTTKELNFILSNGDVLVDKIIRKENNFSVGFMDVIEITKTGEYYRVLYTKAGKLALVNIDKNEANLKILKITGKRNVKGGKVQINLNDGRNMLINNESYKVGDSLVFDLTEKKIKDHLKLDKGSIVYLSGGKHISSVGKIKEIDAKKSLQKPKILCDVDGAELGTLKDYAFVIGKDKPLIMIK